MPETSTPKASHKATASDHLQDAISDLDKAREQAGEDVRASIDAARKRIDEAREDLSGRGHEFADRGQDQVKDWREQLEGAADDALRELGRLAVRAQRSTEALGELSKEIGKREAELGG